MKILDSKTHGIIDYAVVGFLWLSPTLFELSHTIALLTYILGAVHLALTILTDFPYGAVKIIPFKAHGWIELIVGIVLVATPLLLVNFYTDFTEKYFLALFGAAVLLTWSISNYQR